MNKLAGKAENDSTVDHSMLSLYIFAGKIHETHFMGSITSCLCILRSALGQFLGQKSEVINFIGFFVIFSKPLSNFFKSQQPLVFSSSTRRVCEVIT